MNAALSHRGPDSTGVKLIDGRELIAALGSTRLTIRGEGAGNQPYISPYEGVLVYNGELFGQEVSESDTVALANSLAINSEEDSDFLNRVEGMYAFAYYDVVFDDIIGARDDFGIKPLWFDVLKDDIRFSSEVRGLLASDPALGQPSPTRLAELLTFRCVSGRAGLCENIWSVPPGLGFTVDTGEDKLSFSIHLPDDPIFPLPEADTPPPTLSQIQTALKDSLLQNLTSDRPVGLMLSGGIDSGLLACMAAEEGVKLPCFTTEGPEYQQAEALAKRLGHPIIQVDVPRGTEDWLAFLRHSPAPIADPGGYMTWCVAKAAKAEGVPVLLSGAGADEVWLGYRRHEFWHKREGWLNSKLFQWAAPLLHKVDSRFSKAASGDPMAVYRKTMAAPGNLADYLQLPVVSCQLPELPDMPDLLWMDLFTYLPDQVLLATDLYSMAHSVEVRVPYLTRKMVGMAWALGKNALLKEGPKTPLRQLFKQYGGQIQPKTGFGPSEAQYPNFREMDEALGLDKATHPIYEHLPFEEVAKWRGKKMGLQARLAFWCAGVQMGMGGIEN